VPDKSVNTVKEAGKMSTQRITRRSFLRLAGAAGGTLALAACAAPAAPAPAAAPTAAPAKEQPTVAPAAQAPAAGKASVRYAMWDWYAYAPGIKWDEWNQKTAFPKFKEEAPEIEVSWEPLGDGWEDKVLTEMAANTAPDIISTWSPNIETWSEKKQLLDLQPLIDKDIPNHESLYIKSAWAQMWDPFRNIRMGMLADLDITSIYYDKAAFQEAGVALPTVDWTTDDYTQAAQKLTKKDSSGKITRWGTELRPDVYNGYLLYVEAFGGLARDEETRMTCLLDKPEAQEAMEWIRHGMWDLNCFAQSNQMAATGLPSTWTGVLPAKVVAMAERSADQFFSLSDSMPEGSWDIAHIPKGPKGRACMGVPDEWVMFKGVTTRGNQDAAWKFMKWLAGDWYQSKISGVAGRIPGLLSQVSGWADNLRNLDGRLKQVNLKVLQEQIDMGYAKRAPVFKYQQVAEEILGPAMEAILVEGKQPVSYLKEIAPKITQAQKDADARAKG
jgi:multiple sugar transport system substrate-binding protein